MINILVVEDNIAQAKNLINYISQKRENIKLYGMTYSGEEAFNIILNGNVDIILLDLRLLGMTGIQIIKKLEKENIEKYLHSIIVISGDFEMIKEIYNSPYVHSYFLKPLNLEQLCEVIDEMIIECNKIDEKTIRKKIINELKILNFNFMHEGTKYLVDCIYLIYESGKIDDINLSKDFYPYLAKKYKKTTNTIYGDIKQSINSMFLTCEKDILKKYFKYNFLVKPKPKEVIYIILNNILN